MKTHAPVTRTQNASEAFAAILRHNLDHLHDWTEQARDWHDIEGVHQLRVSLRRLRSALSVFRGLVARQDRKYWSRIIRELFGPTRLARDIDVLIEESMPAFHDAHPGKQPVGNGPMMDTLNAHRTAAYESVRAMLDSAAFAGFDREFTHWIDTAGWHNADLARKKKERLAGQATVLGAQLLQKQDRKVRDSGARADRDNPDDLHRLRIECKKLRYTGEFFFTLFEGMEIFLRHMKGLQDALGIMHDAAVTRFLVDSLLPADADPELQRYATALLDWQADRYLAQAESLGPRWEKFLRAQRPWQ